MVEGLLSTGPTPSSFILIFIISYLHVQGSKVGGKMDQIGGKSKKKKLNSAEFMEFVFSKSVSSIG